MERSSTRGRLEVAHFETTYRTTGARRGAMKRPLLAMLAAIGLLGAAAGGATAARTSPSLSFFSGGHGGHADWLATDDQPPGDTDHQAIRLLTTNGAPDYAKGYAGILFHHVKGIPAADFPDSSFWNKTPDPYIFEPYTQGSPRLIVQFQNAAGQYSGNAELDQNVRLNDWEHVSDVDDPGNSGWDIHSATCLYAYHQSWGVAQACHAGETVLTVYIVADAYGVYHLIDDISVNGVTFSSASDNGAGNNDAAGPEATTDASLLPPLPITLPTN
jgi:hypothetical protein